MIYSKFPGKRLTDGTHMMVIFIRASSFYTTHRTIPYTEIPYTETSPIKPTQPPRPNPRSHFFSNFSPFPYRPLSIYTVVLVIVLAHTQHDNVRKRYTFHNSNSYTTLYTISLLANTVHNNNDSKSCG